MSDPGEHLPDGTWTADPMFSSVTFSVRHQGVSLFRAGFREIDATLDGDAGTLTGAVPVTSIDISRPDFRERLLSDEFFDADRYPDVRFACAELQAGADRAVVAPGELTIHGTTRPVEARGRLGVPGPRMMGPGDSVGLELSATIDRREFGLDWQEELPGGGETLAYEVTLEVVLELVRTREIGPRRLRSAAVGHGDGAPVARNADEIIRAELGRSTR